MDVITMATFPQDKLFGDDDDDDDDDNSNNNTRIAYISNALIFSVIHVWSWKPYVHETSQIHNLI